jgi:outer membrane autotransporter protein
MLVRLSVRRSAQRPRRAAHVFAVTGVILAGASLVGLTPALAAPVSSDIAPFSPGDDREENTGTLVIGEGRDYGAGDDMFTNKGVLRFAKSAAPLNLAFTSLERFANDGGLIDLRNERAGDVFSLSGSYAASGDARLGLDIGAGTADRFVIGGGASGRTGLLLTVAPGDARLMAKGLTVATVGSSSASSAFYVANPDQGLVRYAVSYDSSARAYLLNASAGLAVHQTVRAGEGLATAWRASADAFGAEQAMARAAGGDTSRVWFQLHGGRLDRKSEAAAFDLAYDQTTAGGQMGASLGAHAFAGGQGVVGLTGGYVDSRLAFDDSGLRADIETVNVGVYSAWRRMGFFSTVLIKADRHHLNLRSPAAGFEADLDGASWGGQLEAGYRIALEGGGFEPIVGLDYVRSSMDDVEVLGQRIVFDDRGGFSARVGAQGFIRKDLAEDRAVIVSLAVEAVQDLDIDQTGRLISGGQTDAVVLEGQKTFARTRLVAQFQTAGGLQAFVQGEGRFGENQLGGGVRAGARYRF